MGSIPRLPAVMGVALGLGAATALAFSPQPADAAPLPAPSPAATEPVTVREVITAREVVVTRADGTDLRVRFPGVTVPEGTTPNGDAVCGAAQALASTRKLLPPGRVATLSVVRRDSTESWTATAAADTAQYAADGALYADLATASKALIGYGGSVASGLAKAGWLRTSTRMDVALADPTEVGLAVGDRFVDAEVLAVEAEEARRGVYTACGGAFRSAKKLRPSATDWTVDRRGRVRAIGKLKIKPRLTGAKMQKALGPAEVLVRENYCVVRWPARGLSAYPLPVRIATPTGTGVGPPPKTVALCLARRISELEQIGRATRLDGMRAGTKLKRLQRKVPVLRPSAGNPGLAQVGKRRSGSPDGSVWVALDRKKRLTGLVVSLKN